MVQNRLLVPSGQMPWPAFSDRTSGAQAVASRAFSEVLASQADDSGQDGRNIDTGVPEGRYTGFFKRIEEEKIQALREKILREMGLTEESLSQMDPDRRARVEAMVAEEIQRRMALSSLDKDGPGVPALSPATGFPELLNFRTRPEEVETKR